MRTLWLVPRGGPPWLRYVLVPGLLLMGAWRPSFAVEADLALTGRAVPQPVVVDRALAFYLELVNQGPDSAEEVTVEVDLPAEVGLMAASASQGVCQPGPPLICELGQIDANYPANRVSIAVETVANVVAGVSLAATVTSATPDPVPDNNFASPWVSIVALSSSADVRVGSQILPQVAFAGTATEYVIEVANDGPSFADVVDVRVGIQELRMASFVSASSSQGQCRTLLDTCVGIQCLAVLNELLAVSCDLGDLTAGTAALVRVTASIDLPVAAELTVAARAEASNTADPDPSNNSAATVMLVTAVPSEGIEGGGGGGGCFVSTLGPRLSRAEFPQTPSPHQAPYLCRTSRNP